jgi:hypothetical protein
VNAREEAQRFLDQLRAQTHAALGTSPARLPPALAKDVVDQTLRDSFTPEVAQDPHLRARMERIAALAVQDGLDDMMDDMMSDQLAEMQDHIEKTAAARIEGLGVGQRPLVGHLSTGQLNAVSMRVPGRSKAYLVLFEDQMSHFVRRFGFTVAQAIPRDLSADTNSERGFKISVRAMTERIEANPEIADRFADIVVTYAVTGRIGLRGDPLPPGYVGLAAVLHDSLTYFVLGHEYAHIMLGHLDTTAARKGVLPATEAEALVYSWQQELIADFLGMILSLNASIDHNKVDFGMAFWGIGLFFDALDVMDRAVSLLQTGDENVRQLGSHPPSDLRKQRMRESLSKMAESAYYAESVRRALGMDEIQTEITRLLWERTRPILLERRRRDVPAAHTWRDHPEGDRRRAGTRAVERTGAEAGPPPRPTLGPLQLVSSTWQAAPASLREDCALWLRAPLGSDRANARRRSRTRYAVGRDTRYLTPKINGIVVFWLIATGTAGAARSADTMVELGQEVPEAAAAVVGLVERRVQRDHLRLDLGRGRVATVIYCIAATSSASASASRNPGWAGGCAVSAGGSTLATIEPQLVLRAHRHQAGVGRGLGADPDDVLAELPQLRH